MEDENLKENLNGNLREILNELTMFHISENS